MKAARLKSLLAALLLSQAIVASGSINNALARPANAVDIAVTSKPIKSFVALGFNNKRFGKLEFLGGIELISSNRKFGGFSGLRLSKDRSRLTAVSDIGNWLHADLVRKNGVVSGVKNAVLTPILSRSGKRHTSKRNADAEGLAIVGNTAFVSFERNHRIERYRLDRNGFASNARPLGTKFKNKGIRGNRGLESVAIAPKGAKNAGMLVTFPEKLLTISGNRRGYLVRKGKKSKITLIRNGDYKVTDTDFLPNGDLLLLERLAELPASVGAMIRRISAAELVSNKVLKGEIIFSANLTNNIDNMEGLAVSTNKAGEAFISLMSDNNFNKRLQRTLYLEFKLVE